MSKIIFVIGANATGKTFFIHHKFSESEYHILNIYDYQVKFLEEAGHSISMKEQMSLLLKAQHTIIDDAVTFLKRNENVVMEHTLFNMNTRKFWHYCEVCGKKAYLTAEEAYGLGWDYPPKMGIFCLLLCARKCGDCDIRNTLFWKIHQQEIPLVIKSMLTPEELKTWERIRHEPESLLEEEQE